MEIRAITFFTQLPVHASSGQMQAHLQPLGKQAALVEQLFADAGFSVQSLRLATQPLQQLLPNGATPEQLAVFAAEFEQAAGAAGFKHLALGTLGAGEGGDAGLICQLLEGLPAVVNATDWVFNSLQLADRDGGFRADLLSRAAQVVLDNSTLKDNGFGNLRYCMVANMPAFSPFFPAAWHDGGSPPAFSIAIESADRLVEILSPMTPAQRWSAGPDLTADFNALGAQLDAIAATAADASGLDYRGIDMTPSPYPSMPRSLGQVVELLTGDAFGGPGTVAAVALIKQSLEAADFQRAGYCAVMLLPLEDAVLAQGGEQQRYDISTLLACAAAGATGLDVIPVSGDLSRQKIEGLMRDTAQLSLVLDRPLTVRLLPVPGLAAGQMTDFDFDYFAATRAFSLPGESTH